MGRAIDQCQFHRPVEKPRALGRRLWLPKQRSDSGTTVLAIRPAAIAVPRKIGTLQVEIAKLETIVAGQRADLERERHRTNALGDELLKATLALPPSCRPAAALRTREHLTSARWRS